MIIDSHVHIGNIMNFNMPEEMVCGGLYFILLGFAFIHDSTKEK